MFKHLVALLIAAATPALSQAGQLLSMDGEAILENCGTNCLDQVVKGNILYLIARGSDGNILHSEMRAIPTGATVIVDNEVGADHSHTEFSIYENSHSSKGVETIAHETGVAHSHTYSTSYTTLAEVVTVTTILTFNAYGQLTDVDVKEVRHTIKNQER